MLSLTKTRHLKKIQFLRRCQAIFQKLLNDSQAGLFLSMWYKEHFFFVKKINSLDRAAVFNRLCFDNFFNQEVDQFSGTSLHFKQGINGFFCNVTRPPCYFSCHSSLHIALRLLKTFRVCVRCSVSAWCLNQSPFTFGINFLLQLMKCVGR